MPIFRLIATLLRPADFPCSSSGAYGECLCGCSWPSALVRLPLAFHALGIRTRANDITQSDRPTMETAGQLEPSQSVTGQRAHRPPLIRALLLPIKDLRNSRRRLARVRTLEKPMALEQAMFDHPILAVGGVNRA